jgi:hypothetical protein
MRASPFALTNPTRRKTPSTVQFSDPDIPGAAFSIELRPLKGVDMMAIEDLVAGYVTRYITGSGPVDDQGHLKKGDPNYTEPEPLPAIDGEPVVITETTARVASVIEFAQVEGDKVGFVELLGWLYLSDAISAQVVECYGKLMTGVGFDPPAPKPEASSGSASDT